MIFALAALRALHLASLMILFGSALLLGRLRLQVPELAIESNALRNLRLLCVLTALIGALAWLGGGQIFAAQLIVPVLIAGALLIRWEALTAPLSGLGLALISLTSHAAASSPAHFAAVGIVTDALHLLCAGVWLGGLCVLAAIMAQRRAAPRLPAAVALFAQWGMIAVALLAMTGLINAASILLAGPGHDAPFYLGVLGAKLVLVLAMVLLALNNHFRLMPRLGRPEASATLQGNIAWEIGLGLIVLLLAGLLGLLHPTL